MLFSSVLAQAAPQQPGMLESFLPFVLIIAIFWFLILRPQNKKMKAHREMVNNVRRGDTVVTAGGLVGKVTKVKDDDAEIEVEIADGVRVRVIKTTLSDVRAKGEPAVAADEKK
jgi:preprotein translocase subunit YajC